MRRGHDGYVNRTNGSSNPRETLSPREVDLCRAVQGLSDAGRQCTPTELGAWLGVTRGTAGKLRDSVLERGAIKRVGSGKMETLRLTEVGMSAVGGD